MSTIAIRRKNSLNLFREAPKLQSFDEFPVLRPDVDPQLLVNNNRVDQPFHLIYGKDSVIALVSGRLVVEFAQGAVRYFDLEPGDFVYVPAGIAHRILVKEPGIQLRYRAREPGLEAVAWFCEGCATEMSRHVWDGDKTLSQDEYQVACTEFNGDAELRKCLRCGHEHAPVDLSAFRWADVAQTIRADLAGASA